LLFHVFIFYPQPKVEENPSNKISRLNHLHPNNSFN
jgi:hypothetical protein